MNHRWLKKKLAWILYQQRDLRHARCLHATSEPEAAQFRKLGFTQPLIILPNGVDVPESLPRRSASAGQRVILFMSRIHPKKGLPLLLHAWRRARIPGWKVRIVGPDEGGHASELRALAADEGIDADITIDPPVSDQEKWGVFASANIFVLPTYSENFGIVVAEALAAGLPVITTTGTPWTELDQWRAGWCVEPSADGIEAALRNALSMSDAELTAMGQRGRHAVAERFSWPAIARQMQDAYEWILNGGTPPECVRLN